VHEVYDLTRVFVGHGLKMEFDRLKNLLMALSVAITDHTNSSNEKLLEFKGEASAAVLQIGLYPSVSILELSMSLGLSHSATVRLASKLELRKLIDKKSGKDGREVELNLTSEGESMMRDILQKRSDSFDKMIAPLGGDERQNLELYLSKILGKVACDENDAIRICRMCDGRVCPDETCPVAYSS